MKIENLRSEKTENLAKVAATVIWEDCDRPSQEIYFETTQEFAQDLTCNPNAFLTACIMPAMRHGEARISIDAEICPELRDGLITAMSWIRHWYEWYEPDRKLVQIEAKTRSSLPTPRTPERAGWFCSGGIDSLATLRANRLNFPLEHPGSIKDGLFVYGACPGGGEVETANEYLEAFERAVDSLSHVTEDAGVTLIPVYTNAQQLDNHHQFWIYEFQGAVLAAVAHAFSRRLTTVSISSGSDISGLAPHGSHPFLDENYSSYDLRIKHDCLTLSRLAKTKLVADWDVAFQNLKVCTKAQRMQPGMLNCGKCEKCIRTITTLLALGKLDQTRAFPEIGISEELLVNRVRPTSPYRLACYRELIPLLKDRGRHDLVRGIERLTARYYGTDWWERSKRFVRKQFKRSLLSSKKLLGSPMPQ
jgi:hypothetical protein